VGIVGHQGSRPQDRHPDARWQHGASPSGIPDSALDAFGERPAS